MGIVSESVRQSSRAGAVWGFAVVLIGTLAIMAPFLAGISTTMLLALLVTAAGMMITVFAFKAGSFGKGLFQFLFGGITIICGVCMFMLPGVGLMTMTAVMLGYFLADGIFTIIAGFRMKPAEGWGWLIFSGAASLLLAYLLYSDWPDSGQYAIGILVGVRLIFTGWSMAMLGFAGDAVSDEIEQVTGQSQES